MEKDGWWENPGHPGQESEWNLHAFKFSDGGSQMHAIDLDKDGRNEILTGIHGHGYGLVYYKSLDEKATKFERFEIMTDNASTSPMGIAVSQLHAVDVADMNGDGLMDIVTGKRWWAHANKDAGNSEPAILMYLETQLQGGRIGFVPHIVDTSSGVGTQVTAADVNLDGLIDIVCGIKRGAYVFLQIPPGQESVVESELLAQDRFGQKLAQGKAKVDDELGGFVPALGDRPLEFIPGSPTSSDVQDWETRGTIAAHISKPADDLSLVETGREQLDAIGEAISRPFVLFGQKLGLDVTGNADPEARVELISEVSGAVLATVVPESETVARKYVDISKWSGQAVRLRVVDHASKGYVGVGRIRIDEAL